MRVKCAPAVRSAICRSATTTRAAALVGAPLKSSDKIPALAEVDMMRFVNEDGLILPRHAPGAAASVFAVMDKDKKLQYVGFSKDIRNSLRTMIARRPDTCFYFKSARGGGGIEGVKPRH